MSCVRSRPSWVGHRLAPGYAAGSDKGDQTSMGERDGTGPVRRIVLTSDLGFSGAGPLTRGTEADLEIVR
jgi:hypothetical protein